MAEKVIIEYEVVQKGGEKVVSVVQDITQAWEESEQASKAALSEKQIDTATASLSKFNAEAEKTSTEFKSVSAELKSLTKDITSGKLSGKELQDATKRAAELKDRIGDVRTEIKKLSSDTRLFDTLVEGGRGIAAAFSVAAGAAALFGKENEDLQKTLAKAQGALALLTGAQELANIVTTKGGLATQAYGLALQAVDKIAKVTGLSIQASMAVATAGVALLVAGVVGLIAYFNDAGDASEELKRREEERKKITDELAKNGEQRFNAQRFLTEEQQKLNELEIVTLKARGATKTQILNAEIRQLNELGQILDSNLRKKEEEFKFADDDFKRKLTADELLAIEKNRLAILEKRKDLAAELFKIEQSNNKAIENVEVKTLTLTPQEIKIDEPTKVPEVEIKVSLKPEPQLSEEDKKRLQDAYFQFATSAASSLQGITQNIFAGETAALEEEKQNQLRIAGDDAKKREEIEKQFAIKSAQIRRKQAISDRAFALTQVAINVAQGISKLLADPALPAAAPFIALTAATAALQTAAILSQPLPEIPKFEKGVIKLKRGKNPSGIDTIPAYLTEGESVMTVAASNKYTDELKAAQDLQLEDLVYQKYVLPALKNIVLSNKEADTYDDFNLRRTIKQGQEADRQNSQNIVDGIVRGISRNNYLTQRYFA